MVTATQKKMPKNRHCLGMMKAVWLGYRIGTGSCGVHAIPPYAGLQQISGTAQRNFPMQAFNPKPEALGVQN